VNEEEAIARQEAPEKSIEEQLEELAKFELPDFESGTYEAFRGGSPRGRRSLLFLPSGGQPWQRIAYDGLWLSREEPDGTCIGLTYHSAGVVIGGENFGRLGWMIDRRMCVFLQQHDPERHRAPAPGAPVIRRMEFFYPPQIAPTDPARSAAPQGSAD
jgi:hypothetical protein